MNTPWRSVSALNQLLWENICLGSKPNRPVLLGWTVKNTDTVLMIHHVEL